MHLQHLCCFIFLGTVHKVYLFISLHLRGQIVVSQVCEADAGGRLHVDAPSVSWTGLAASQIHHEAPAPLGLCRLESSPAEHRVPQQTSAPQLHTRRRCGLIVCAYCVCVLYCGDILDECVKPRWRCVCWGISCRRWLWGWTQGFPPPWRPALSRCRSRSALQRKRLELWIIKHNKV